MKKSGQLIREILVKRGFVTSQAQRDFLNPSYEATKHDPFLMPDMHAAVDRIILAKNRREKVTIYGDYDIDGMTASTILAEAFAKWGIDVTIYVPNRFTEGYGLNMDAMQKIAETEADLIVTVDCGSLSHAEIDFANQLEMDVIVTDHHAVAPTMPNAIATINLRRDDHEYPFRDLAGCGVAFKLVQALQMRHSELDSESSQIRPAAPSPAQTASRREKSRAVDVFAKDGAAASEDCEGVPIGQEKWLLDLVALGTVCDVVNLQDENRAIVRWGLEVLKKTRRPGLKALMAVAKVNQRNVNARDLGFALGPRLNASGRLETAEYALELLRTDDPVRALELAQLLNDMNQARRAEQDKMFIRACETAENCTDSVLVVSDPTFNEGIIGIVAAKLMEKFERPAFVLAEIWPDNTDPASSQNAFSQKQVTPKTASETASAKTISRAAAAKNAYAKGSGRSFGDFKMNEVIAGTMDILTRGGGHAAAGGLTVDVVKIADWRVAVNEFYVSQGLSVVAQRMHLLAKEDILRPDFTGIDEELIDEISQMEPFGHGNPSPIFAFDNLTILDRRVMGDKKQHVKYRFADQNGVKMEMVAFSAAEKFVCEVGEVVRVWCELSVNEWMGRRSVEGRLMRME